MIILAWSGEPSLVLAVGTRLHVRPGSPQPDGEDIPLPYREGETKLEMVGSEVCCHPSLSPRCHNVVSTHSS